MDSHFPSTASLPRTETIIAHISAIRLKQLHLQDNEEEGIEEVDMEDEQDESGPAGEPQIRRYHFYRLLIQ